eukprot:GHVR01117075.1.p1 GENE.GHVR01117075.1~~GHVR01117075.1.p1  ORF type:complete len:340 (-),score=51.32 GHVR01117075.1:735-1754(-)
MTRGEFTYKVLVADSCADEGLNVLRDFATVDVKTKLTEDQLVEIIDEYDAMMVRSATKVTGRIIEAGSKLKIIARAGVGVDNVDIAVASKSGVWVVNSPSGNTIAAAEHTFGLMLASSRMISQADASIRRGKWDRGSFMGSQLHGKVLGLIGLGQVGSHVAKLAVGAGMRIVACDPLATPEKAASINCKLVELVDVLALSDYVSLHVPLNASTKNLINRERIAMMKKSSRIINTSRGGVIDEAALSEALSAGSLAGAALDVFAEEKAFAEDHVLLQCPNLILTPHLGASTSEAQINVAIDVAERIKEALLQGEPTSAVNMQILKRTPNISHTSTNETNA